RVIRDGLVRLRRHCGRARTPLSTGNVPGESRRRESVAPSILPASGCASTSQRLRAEPHQTPAASMTKRYAEPVDSVLDTIGWTPLIRLTRTTRGIRTPVYAKAEIFNPGG